MGAKKLHILGIIIISGVALASLARGGTSVADRLFEGIEHIEVAHGTGDHCSQPPSSGCRTVDTAVIDITDYEGSFIKLTENIKAEGFEFEEGLQADFLNKSSEIQEAIVQSYEESGSLLDFEEGFAKEFFPLTLLSGGLYGGSEYMFKDETSLLTSALFIDKDALKGDAYAIRTAFAIEGSALADIEGYAKANPGALLLSVSVSTSE